MILANIYLGPIGANQTSTPLFFVGNSIDPATAIKKYVHSTASKFTHVANGVKVLIKCPLGFRELLYWSNV